MKKFYAYAVLISSFLLFETNTTNGQVDKKDSLALVDLYNSTDGPNWTNNIKWLTKQPLGEWYGVTNNNNRVVRIEFIYNNLNGSLPASLGNLTELKVLYLYGNKLKDTLPVSLGNLTNLGSLILGNNRLSGNIPESLGNLTKLRHLSLDFNQLSGSIPASLGNLTKLTSLHLNINQLSGSTPASLGNLTKLTSLYLNNNQLSGNIPESLGNLTFLERLNLSNNQLSGTIPKSFGKLFSYSYYDNILDLSENNLTGVIPESIGNCTYLKFLSLSHNKLRGQVPASFSNLKYLRKLDLKKNHLEDTVPSFLASLPYLDMLHIQFNHFTFDGIEQLAKHNFDDFGYENERKLRVHQASNTLSVYAGGTLKKNTYKWFNDGVLAATINGDSTFTPIASGKYSVEVTNAIATELTLKSDTVNYNAFTTIAENDNEAIKANDKTGFSIYPNPAQNVVTVSFVATGKYALQLADMNGNILQTKTGIAVNNKNMVQLNVSKYAAGVYYVTIANERNETQTLRLNKQ